MARVGMTKKEISESHGVLRFGVNDSVRDSRATSRRRTCSRPPFNRRPVLELPLTTHKNTRRQVFGVELPHAAQPFLFSISLLTNSSQLHGLNSQLVARM